MNVLGICGYPIESPCTRYRLLQYVGPLRERGIQLDVRPFFSSDEHERFYSDTAAYARIKTVVRPVARRFVDIGPAVKSDIILIQREAMLVGPAIFEWLYRNIGRKPMVLDLDDAIYMPYESERYGGMGKVLKFFGKTESLIRNSKLVICGGKYLAEYAESLGAKTAVIPTVVDAEKFKPVERDNDPIIIGWIGTPSTFPFLESLFPMLRRLAERYRFKLRIRGAGVDTVSLPGVDIHSLPWSLETELGDFQSFDIGLYPLRVTEKAPLEWIKGKSGFKAIQYLTLGLPFVMSPIGVTADMGIAGETHFEARSDDEWEAALETLISNRDLRTQMGNAGRQHALKEYDLNLCADRLAQELMNVLR